MTTNGADSIVTREALRASWNAARRAADVSGAVQLNAASCAGQLLEIADGDAAIAITMVPSLEGSFWRTVVSYLQRVAKEDAA